MDPVRHSPDIASIMRQRIRRMRLQRDLTQANLAELAGISLDALCRIESGRRNPSLESIVRISEALGVAASDLLSTGRLPPLRQPASVRRVAALLESRDSRTRAVAEAVVQSLLDSLPRLDRPREETGIAEKISETYAAAALFIHLPERRVAFRGVHLPEFSTGPASGAVFAVLVLLASSPGKPRTVEEIEEWLGGIGASLPSELSNEWVLRDRLLQPFRRSLDDEAETTSGEIERLVEIDSKGGLELSLDPAGVAIVGLERCAPAC